MAIVRRLREWAAKALSPASPISGSWVRIFDSTPGDWQAHDGIADDNVLSFHAIFACITLIASDIAKLRYKLVEKNESGVWREVNSAAFSPVLRRPNQYQNQIQFREHWMISKLAHGNCYALKERDNRGVVVHLHLLHPARVTPLVSETGDVFYQLKRDNLTGVSEEDVIVPAREIIHDRMNCFHHPLIGVSPIQACGIAAKQGLAIQKNQSKFFGNNARPSGILSAQGNISPETANEIRQRWKENYSGENYGAVAVLGNDMKFVPMAVTAEDAQVVEQLKLTAEIVCSTFHVPMHMIDLAPPPPRNNEDTYLGYYSRALQVHIESMEACLDEGLGLDGFTKGVELDTGALMRMDTLTRYKAWSEAIGGGWMHPNAARISENLDPVQGGDTPYLQQQNFSLAALDERDKTNPLAVQPPPPEPTEPEPEEPSEEENEERAMVAGLLLEKELRNAEYA